MPKLSEFVRDHKDLSDRFVVVGIHQSGGGTLAQIRASIASKEVPAPLHADLLPVLVHDAEDGCFLRYRPQALGDKVLLGPDGVVLATGDAAIEVLRARLEDVRERVSDLTSRLSAAKAPGQVASLLADLCAVGLASADEAAEGYVLACPPALARTAIETMAQQGRWGSVAGALRHRDAKWRKAALAILADHPPPELAPALLEVAAKKGVGDDATLALRLASACAPGDAAVVARVLEISVKGDIPTRAAVVPLLAALQPPARERLLAMLAKDNAPRVRTAAASALAALGGEDAVAALERAAAEDKVEAVRAAAQKALASMGAPPAAAPK